MTEPNIIRNINKKNKIDNADNVSKENNNMVEKIIKKPDILKNLSEKDTNLFINEIENIKKESDRNKQDKEDTENKYRYDVRILNVLATSGLKATSIAHELKNNRNNISVNYEYIVDALKTHNVWDILNSPECTEYIDENVPYLLESNYKVNKKILVFINTILDEVEKQNFEPVEQNIYNIFCEIKRKWCRDYAILNIDLDIDENMHFYTSIDILSVIFDNLILNSFQQNEERNKLTIKISVYKENNILKISYSDDGKGLQNKYKNDPNRILEVHETTRKNGHGLGMWIVNNTVLMTGGIINNIEGNNGFKINFEIGDRL